nr:MAG TPA: hypothetical protein [Caudoviricetes sp.]
MPLLFYRLLIPLDAPLPPIFYTSFYFFLVLY